MQDGNCTGHQLAALASTRLAAGGAAVIMWIINRDATSGHPVTAGHRSTGPGTRPLKTRATRSYVSTFLRNRCRIPVRAQLLRHRDQASDPEPTDLSARGTRTTRRARADLPTLDAMQTIVAEGFHRGFDRPRGPFPSPVSTC